MRDKNETSALRKLDVYENDDLKAYNFHNKNVNKEMVTDKTVRKNEKDLLKFKMEQSEMNTMKLGKVI